MAGPGFEGDATANGSTSHWATYVASAIGADHQRARTKNQDAVTARRFEFRSAPGMVAFAVADGHGHSRHFRSARGSKMAVTAAMASAKDWARTVPEGSHIPSERATELVLDLVARWRDMVAADLAGDPITGDQRAALLPGDPPEIPYGSTLLVGMLRTDVAVLAQIGDGEMVMVLPDGRHLIPIPTDSRLDGTQTTSLCQPDAESAFRVALVNLLKTPVFAVLATTDGYGNAQADPHWHQTLALDLVKLASQHGNDWIGDQLSHWVTLCASSGGSGDDTSAALALNSAVSPAVPAKPVRQRTVEAAITTMAARDTTLPSMPLPVDAPASFAASGQLPVSQQPTAEIPALDQTMRVGRQPPPAAGRSREAETNRIPQVLPPSAVPPPRSVTAPHSLPTTDYASPGRRSFLPGQSRLWLGGAVVAALAVVIVYFLLSHGSSGGPSPAFSQSHKPSPTATPTKTTSGSLGSGKHKSAKPSPLPSTIPSQGGGGIGAASGHTHAKAKPRSGSTNQLTIPAAAPTHEPVGGGQRNA
ncbi:MAG TPA: protein phosphatase 2C domain-containing protein [Streptosporangiaceae bacterium]|nr:protein phosphatase 2C domain-containing protein [Streptosporangiaceae bacterium]